MGPKECVTILAIIVIVAIFSTAEGCSSKDPMSMQELEVAAMDCAKNDFLFMMQIGEIASSKDEKAKINFMCHHIPNIAKLAECLVKKMTPCAPEAVRPLMSAMPNKQRIEEALGFMCKARNVITAQSSCLDNSIQAVMSCYQTRVAQIVSVATPADNPVELMCRVIHAEEKCLVDNHGSCTTSFIEVLTGTLEKLFPKSVCSAHQSQVKAVETNQEKQKQMDLAKQIFQSILVHGEPQGQVKDNTMKFKPYVIKN